MRVLLTGGTGFIGGRVARKLRAQGYEVVALVRSEARATELLGLGCELAFGDVVDEFSVQRAMTNIDAVMHLAGRYDIGIKKSECPKMQDVNIGGVRHVLDAAIQAGVDRIVYASSISVFGNTGETRATEGFKRNESDGFLSCYDQSKYRAHLLAKDRARDGAPIVLVQPGMVYGPGDHSEVGRQILQAASGKLPAVMFPDLGVTLAHVDDVADGFVSALDNGRTGESYILGGDVTLVRHLLKLVATISGRRLPPTVPVRVLKWITPVAPWFAPKLGYPPNLREVIRSANGVTYWCDDTKARTELHYKTRSLEEGLCELLGRT
jgi:nucleoside-diphosphate-sugar epimerase